LLAKLTKNIEANQRKDDLYRTRLKSEPTSRPPDSWEAMDVEEPRLHPGAGQVEEEKEDLVVASEEALDQRRKALSSEQVEKLLAFRQKLPSFQKRSQLLELVHGHQVILVSGETGCGKTTQVPMQ
jgi:HrpA-like RNA helicase